MNYFLLTKSRHLPAILAAFVDKVLQCVWGCRLQGKSSDLLGNQSKYQVKLGFLNKHLVYQESKDAPVTLILPFQHKIYTLTSAEPNSNWIFSDYKKNLVEMKAVKHLINMLRNQFSIYWPAINAEYYSKGLFSFTLFVEVNITDMQAGFSSSVWSLCHQAWHAERVPANKGVISINHDIFS